MEKSFLVTYASKYGSTEEIAKTIAETIRSHGAAVDVLPWGEVKSLERYDAVIIGSAVRFGAWMKEAIEFVKTNQRELAGMPVAIFSVYILNQGNEVEHLAARESYTALIHSLIPPRTEAFFPGVIEMDQLSLPEKMITKTVKAGTGDFRDWGKIKEWAETAWHLLSLEKAHHQRPDQPA